MRSRIKLMSQQVDNGLLGFWWGKTLGDSAILTLNCLSKGQGQGEAENESEGQGLEGEVRYLLLSLK